MKKRADLQKASMDDGYYVSAADLADKIIEHIWRGLDPLQFSSSSLALFPLDSPLTFRSGTKPD